MSDEENIGTKANSVNIGQVYAKGGAINGEGHLLPTGEIVVVQKYREIVKLDPSETKVYKS